MRLALLALAISLAFSACGGGGPCENQSGTYLLQAVQRNGNCGNLEQVVILPDWFIFSNPECQTVSSDKCVVTLNKCRKNLREGGFMVFTGDIDWESDGSEAKGTLSASQSSGFSCSGTFDVTYRRK